MSHVYLYALIPPAAAAPQQGGDQAEPGVDRPGGDPMEPSGDPGSVRRDGAASAGDPAGGLGAGLAGEPLGLVALDGFDAIVGRLAAPPTPDAAGLRAHDEAVRRLARRAAALLPARFGQAATCERDLAEQLAPRAGALRDALAKVHGCVQMTLRLFGAKRDPATTQAAADGSGLDPAATEASAQDPPGGSAGGGAGAAGPGTRYLLDRARVRRLADAAPELVGLRAALGSLVVSERVERVPARGGRAARLDVYHLIRRDAVARYRREVSREAEALAPLPLVLSGPWPAYAFSPETLPSASLGPAGGPR